VEQQKAFSCDNILKTRIDYIQGMKIAKQLTAAFIFLTGGTMAIAQPFNCGSTIPAPNMSSSQKHLLDSQLTIAKTQLDKNTSDADALIWYARRLGYAGRYYEAVEALTSGIKLHPGDARMYRHRGHRYFTLRCFEKAIADLEKAATLVQAKPDEVEPDGQPNEANIPTSTLQTNIYYHLGLAWFCKKDIDKATQAFAKSLELSKNNDMYVASANWLHLMYRIKGNESAACRLLNSIGPNMELLENHVYHQILMLYKNKTKTPEALATAQNEKGDVQGATYLYGLYMYLKWSGAMAEANHVKNTLLQTNQYGSFGYITAEQD
jgi:tetratricopeptide (TPR) repeat protein